MLTFRIVYRKEDRPLPACRIYDGVCDYARSRACVGTGKALTEYSILAIVFSRGTGHLA